jgi:hypothetical protein
MDLLHLRDAWDAQRRTDVGVDEPPLREGVGEAGGVQERGLEEAHGLPMMTCADS